MSLFRLTLRNVLHRRFLSLLTVCAVAVTVAFIVLLTLSRESVEQGAKKGYGPFDLVLGAAGSETQLVLNTFYHIGAPTGNIPLAVLDQARQDQSVAEAYAMTTGDNYKGFPIVGLESGYFYTRYGDTRLQEGSMYAHTGETIVGSYVAKSLGLKIGDTFSGAHGLVQEEAHGEEHVEEQDDEDGEDHAHGSFRYTVTGILPELHTPDDRAVFTTVDYAWAVHGLAPEDREITAVLVKPASLLGAHDLRQELDGSNGVQAAYTSKAVSDVLNAVDQGSRLLSMLTAICVLLAGISILLSLIAAAGERTKDVGLLRLLGKSRAYVWLTLTCEGLLVTATGLIAGLLLGHLGAFLLKDALFAQAGIQIQPYHWTQEHWLIAIGAITIGLLSSLGPAFRMYRMHPLALFKS
ncbi:ABC transporter permease [Paenibacillus sp. FSL R7-0273]|uniref:ABC transporter permease n=1 Tax=Paenibacillus sp. FSL R7-0273 TaxID=1536772 RepID=UPI0004F653F1|nr:ABC transporter permease [Paenibacillus sp. FSL R7-0273]AIQ49611.1 ABC transporter permease [Paenibacillus sp. FSL R7-0273]OMF90326.1 ABC transporter permease [Paenibacillus sp. FSL R7-0273]